MQTTSEWSEWVSEWRHISTNKLYNTIHVGIHRKIRTEDENQKTDITKTKHDWEKSNNTKYSKTTIPWFSRLTRHSLQTTKDNEIDMRYWCSLEHCTNLAWAVKHILLSTCSTTLHTIDTWPSTRKTASFADNFHRSVKYSLDTDEMSEEPELRNTIQYNTLYNTITTFLAFCPGLLNFLL